MPVPRTIHQIWIGEKTPPYSMMQTWKDKNPDCEYIFWNEAEFIKRNMMFICQHRIDRIKEIVGKVDIMRLEILYKYGGVYIDADSICIEPLDDHFFEKTGFATYENENIRKDLVATGTMGFVPRHRLCGDMIQWILSAESIDLIDNYKAWYSVGPALLTRMLNTGVYTDFSVYPSHCFLPIHFTGVKYLGHKKVYAFQEWGNTKNSYDQIAKIELPEEFRPPKMWVSILISSYNTDIAFVRDCLNSIKLQNGHFGMEVIWIDDGSTFENSILLERELKQFETSTRFCKVVYKKLHDNCGLSFALHQGVLLCSHSLIIRMDSDDIMFPDKIQTQIDFMKQNPDCVLCGTNIKQFTQKDFASPKVFGGEFGHPEILTLDMYMKSRHHWVMNHPTVCIRKEAVLAVGNYNPDMPPDWIIEDFELALKILKKYGRIHNIPKVFLLHRHHDNQSTKINMTDSPENVELRNKMIENILL